jgi:hypothetical protein
MRMLNPPAAMKLNPPRRVNNRSVSVMPMTMMSSVGSARDMGDVQSQLDSIIKGSPGGQNNNYY